MPTVAEAVNNASDKDPLLQGLSVLSQHAEIPFTQYIRYVLPLDGYVYWLRTKTLPIAGSLHVSAQKRQLEDETISVNRAVFTTGAEVEPFNEIDPNTIWVGETGGLKFAFSQRGAFYRAAGLFHYSGDAVYPALESQLVDVGAELSARTLIVSNSLPAWLVVSGYSPIWWTLNPAIPLYPSFLVPANLRPPYGAVHINPAETRALQAIPRIGHNSSHHQLARDLVRVTLYGATNEVATAFLDTVMTYSRDTDAIGIMAPAVIRDEKRPQTELGILAMKKTIEFEVSYQQSAMRRVAQQMIETVVETFEVNPFPLPPLPPFVGVH